jgi:hypothetical protein
VTVNAATTRVKNNDDAPMFWKWKVTNDWRHSRLAAMSAIDNQATAME